MKIFTCGLLASWKWNGAICSKDWQKFIINIVQYKQTKKYILTFNKLSFTLHSNRFNKTIWSSSKFHSDTITQNFPSLKGFSTSVYMSFMLNMKELGKSLERTWKELYFSISRVMRLCFTRCFILFLNLTDSSRYTS